MDDEFEYAHDELIDGINIDDILDNIELNDEGLFKLRQTINCEDYDLIGCWDDE